MPGLEKQRLLERVAQDGRALEYAAAELKADKEIVATAVAQDGRALQYAAAELKADKDATNGVVTVGHVLPSRSGVENGISFFNLYQESVPQPHGDTGKIAGEGSTGRR